MKFEYRGSNPQIYATNLRPDKSSKKLIWDSTSGVDALIVQTPYGEEAIVEALCESLERYIGKPDELQGKYVRISEGVWCRYISSVEKAKNNGCPINGKPARYTVFACVIDENADMGEIYASQNDNMIKPSCDIQVKFHIDIIKEMEVKGIFRKHEVETGFFSLCFQDTVYDGYMNGDLVYCINEFEIPITKEMLEQKKVYIKTAEKPEIKSKNKGLSLR